MSRYFCIFFFFNDTATTEIYTLSLHDALPIFRARNRSTAPRFLPFAPRAHSNPCRRQGLDRKSTRLNSSHVRISYAVFCLKKKNKHERERHFTGAVIGRLTQRTS